MPKNRRSDVGEGAGADRLGAVRSRQESLLEEEDDESVGHSVKGVKLVTGGGVPGRAALRGLGMFAESSLVVAWVQTAVRQRARDVRPDVGLLE